jgi:hypothetical protein
VDELDVAELGGAGNKGVEEWFGGGVSGLDPDALSGTDSLDRQLGGGEFRLIRVAPVHAVDSLASIYNHLRVVFIFAILSVPL